MTTPSTSGPTVPTGALCPVPATATAEAKPVVLTSQEWHDEATALLVTPRQSYAFYMIDIDAFAGLNRTEGYPAADAVLTGTARALREAAGPRAVVSRFGGDEFIVIVPVTDHDQGDAIGRAIRELITKVIVAPDEKLGPPAIAGITASVGGVLAPPGPHTLTAVLWAADAALYSAKQSGGNTVRMRSTAR